MRQTFSIARRLYNQGGDMKRVSRLAIRIATIGVSLGVAVMIIAVCVARGFQKEVQRKVMGMGGQIQVLNYDYQLDLEQHPIVLDNEMVKMLAEVKGVSHVQRFCNKAGMLKTDDAFQGVMLKGVGEDYDLRFLREHLKDGSVEAFSDSAQSQRIIISQLLANDLKLKVGSKVFAYFFDGKVRARRFTVSGIYATNMNEFDKTIIFTDSHTTRRLNGFEDDQWSGAELTVDNLDFLDAVASNVAYKIKSLKDHYGANYTAPTIASLYPGIFSWLSLLDYNVWIILGLMLVVATFTMISGLLIIILERTQFIGVMKALGATNGSLRSIFLYFASFIVVRGIIIGNIIGLGLVVLQQTTGVISLDSTTYYVDVVPVVLNWPFVLLINVGTLLVSIIALLGPSYLVSRIKPAKSIRWE